MVSISWTQVAAFRMARHHLITRAPRSRLVQVVREVCGIQAQVMSAAELALWARIEGITRRDVSDALWKRRAMVKTWCMRGTLHLLPARDFGLWVSALSARRGHTSAAWLRYFGLTLESLDRVMRGVSAALDGKILTREELASEIGRHMGPEIGRKLLSGWGSIFKPPAYQGRLCFGPSRGQHITFVRPDQWLGTWKTTDEATAMRELARRYLWAYGPATADDFGYWWGGTRRGAKTAVRSLGDEVAEIDVEGHRTWALREDLPALRRQKAVDVVRLLPHFDMYTYGCRPRSRLVPARLAGRIFRQAGWVSPVLLVSGVAAGTWELRRTARSAEVQVQPFRPLGRAVKAGVKDEARRLESFLGLPVRVVL
ncbi:MAG TPA: winged helix DNA-binding domain-containing protein [bacterium]